MVSWVAVNVRDGEGKGNTYGTILIEIVHPPSLCIFNVFLPFDILFEKGVCPSRALRLTGVDGRVCVCRALQRWP